VRPGSGNLLAPFKVACPSGDLFARHRPVLEAALVVLADIPAEGLGEFDGAGGAGLYNADLNGQPQKWKPFQAEYIADHSFSVVTVQGKRFTLVQIDKDGRERDRIVVEK